MTISRIVLDADTRVTVDQIQARTRSTSPSAAIALMVSRYGRHLIETWELTADIAPQPLRDVAPQRWRDRYPEPPLEPNLASATASPAPAPSPAAEFQFSEPIDI